MKVRLAVVELNSERNVNPLRSKTTRIELKDDTSEADLRAFLAALHAFSHEHKICIFVIKTRAKKGSMAGGAVSFKIETIFQLVEGCNTSFGNPMELSNYAKTEVKEYPDQLPVYLKNAFLSDAYALPKN